MWGNLFNPDNPVLSFIGKLVDLFVLNLLWILCCLPVITIGPACAALYYAVVKSVRRERGGAVTEFFRAFKVNLKKGIVINLVFLVLGAAMFYSDVTNIVQYLDTGKFEEMLFPVLFVLKLCILVGVACWIYPLLSRFDQSALKLGENALFLCIRYIYLTIPILIVFLFATITMVYDLIFVMVVPVGFTFVLSFFLEPVLKKLCDPEEVSLDDDPWYVE